MNFIKKKIYRLLHSKKILSFFKLCHKIFGEKDIGELNLNFHDKPHRSKIVQWFINKRNFRSYLEIGCFSDELFNKIRCEKKIGVDPVSGGNIKKTSDEFFKDCEEKFDCIFIDGLHEYSQVKKDIINSIKFLNDNGVILLHDCLPKNVFDQAMPRCQRKWNGDVWKAIVEFRTKTNLDTYTCYADEGVGVIFKKKNRNFLNLQIKNFKTLKFEDYFHNFKKFMNIITFEDLKKLD